MFRFRVLLILSLFGLVFAVLAMGQPAAAHHNDYTCYYAATNFKGTVIDASTFALVEGAKVTAVTFWEGNPNDPNDDLIHDSTSAPSYTNSDGRYSHLNAHCGSQLESGFYKIEKDGYKPAVFSSRFPAGPYDPPLIMHFLEPADGADVLWAGLRSSDYGPGIGGITFPPKEKWDSGMNEVANNWNTAVPASIWGIAEVRYCSNNVSEKCGVTFEFADPGGVNEQYIGFDGTKRDHHAYLDHFDAAGIKVFLGIEPGWADTEMDTVIDIALNEFGHHPSVAGVSIDAEFIHFDGDWKNSTPGNVKGGEPVTFEQAQRWEMLVKHHKPSLHLVLKHYHSANLKTGYEGDIIFVDDTQDMGSLNGLLEGSGAGEGMIDFAREFPNNNVLYQIGYPSDWFNNTPPGDDPNSTPTTEVSWFCNMSPWNDSGACNESSIPADEAEQLVSILGNALKNATPDSQNMGIIWVDFTMAKLYPDIFDNAPIGVDDWSPNRVWYPVGAEVSYNGQVWENTFAHWSQVDYYPGAPGLWFWVAQ